MKVENNGFCPNCVYCGAAWSDGNIEIVDGNGGRYSDEWGWLELPSFTISIRCHSCHEEMFRKTDVEIF